jgi:starch synthase
MNVFFITAEATPWVKIGGLADVASELSRSLVAQGLDIRLALPFYPHLKEYNFKTPPELIVSGADDSSFPIPPVDIYRLVQEGVETWLIDGPPIQTPGPVYGDQELETSRFLFFSLAALEACQAMDWRPDVVHAHDWHPALSVVWLAQHRHAAEFWGSVRTILTIHNLPYMGPNVASHLPGLDISPVEHPLLPDWSHAVPLSMGIASADIVTTVSPTYTSEIQTEEYGRGMDALLRARSEELYGIVNGIDYQTWNPATDSSIVQTFDRHSLDKRVENKLALLQECGLRAAPEAPLLGMITRLEHQKGVELAVTALRRSKEVDWQAIFLGTGDRELEAMVNALAAEFPGRVAALVRFDPALARRMYAGLDVILIPSRYEPCGLAQMIAMRYGCIPIVRATGGLIDTVEPFIPPDRGTGFRFEAISSGALAGILDMALHLYQQQDKWRELQTRAMERDFSWQRSAGSYTDLYRRVVDNGAEAGRGA